MYNFTKIEKKWQTYWEEHQTFYTDVWDFSRPKYYVLDMFPYPSAQGLHVGHPEGYTATDIIARYKRMNGYNVLHPMGWDAFGLPAEQYAIKTGNHPDQFTEANIATFKRQLQMLGLSFDWTKEVSTADPKFYHWTQWIFKQMFQDGFAKQVEMPVNWCEELGTVLANDEVIDGKSERGGFPVVRKNMKQWVIDIPKYADKLLEGLETIDFPDSTKEIQKNWIGKSIGAHVNFNVAETDLSFTVFTTRADTLFGATYCVLAPEHQLVEQITTSDQKIAVTTYQKECASKSELERTELNKEKTGIFTGSYAVNPVNGTLIPIFIADYVLASYGTGAIMAVPAHDERDYAFAKKFELPIVPVLARYYEGTPKIEEGFPRTKRNTVSVIVKHPTDNAYLYVELPKFDYQNLLMGGIEENETIAEAAMRELREESGYVDFVIDEVLPFATVEEFFAKHKSVNRILKNRIVVGHLTSLKQEEVDEEEKETQQVIWASADQIIDVLKVTSHKDAMQYVLDQKGAFEEDGIHINSDFLDGLYKDDAIDKMIAWLEEHHCGKRQVNYRIREWIFARQRYWGEPIPVVHFENETVALEDYELPLVLPKLDDYKPSQSGASPLERATDWIHVLKDGKEGTREASTMPGSAGSSWYFLRYIDPNNEKIFADYELLKHWMPVDLYVGGPEHSVGHLLYSRMWNHYLYDKGLVPYKEPFQSLRHQGMILGENGEKMSKSRGNVVNPDDMVKDYGTDALRVYEMFMGPLEASKPWDPNGIEGSKRFLERVYRLYTIEDKITEENDGVLERIYHQTVKKVTQDYETLNFNTAISQMMIFLNHISKASTFPKEYAYGFLKLLNPIAPHITEELWEQLGHDKTISYEEWPTYEEAKTIEDTYEMIVQINGKVRGKLEVHTDTSKEEMERLARNLENVQKYLVDHEIIKVVVVPKKLVNLVVQ